MNRGMTTGLRVQGVCISVTRRRSYQCFWAITRCLSQHMPCLCMLCCNANTT